MTDLCLQLFENKGPPRNKIWQLLCPWQFKFIVLGMNVCVDRRYRKKHLKILMAQDFSVLALLTFWVKKFCAAGGCLVHCCVFSVSLASPMRPNHDSQHLSQDIANVPCEQNHPCLSQRSLLWVSFHSAVHLSFENFVLTMKTKDSWFALFRLHICNFVYLLKCIYNLQINTLGDFAVIPGHTHVQRGQKFESPDISVPSWGQTRWCSAFLYQLLDCKQVSFSWSI